MYNFKYTDDSLFVIKNTTELEKHFLIRENFIVSVLHGMNIYKYNIKT